MAAYESRVSFLVGEGHERAVCTIAVPQSIGVEAGVVLSHRLQEAIMNVARESQEETRALAQIKPEPRVKTEPLGSPRLRSPSAPPQKLSLWLVNEVSVRLNVDVYSNATVNELRWAWARDQGQHGDLFGIEFQGQEVDYALTMEQLGVKDNEFFTVRMKKTGIESLFADV